MKVNKRAYSIYMDSGSINKEIAKLGITEADLPLVVVSDNLKSWFSWAIKKHTKGNYSHVMVMINLGKFVTQGWTYKEVDWEKYLKPHIRLKFWKYRDISKGNIRKFKELVEKDLKQSWWRKRYDILGIIGQAVKLRFIQNPFVRYCTERVAPYVRKVFKILVRYQATPSEMNKTFESDNRMEVEAIWDLTQKEVSNA